MLEELVRINKVNDVSFKEERLSVLIFFSFENEHSHKCRSKHGKNLKTKIFEIKII